MISLLFMSKTKHRILAQSLELFNNHGVSEVPLRTIADEMGISVGNLQYHFKKREDIIEALYFRIVEKVDELSINETDNLLSSFLSVPKKICLILYEYRFFLLDFTSITRKNRKIKNHYAELSKRREKEFLDITVILIENGLLRKELLKNEYHNVFKRVEVISNFWFSSILIQSDVLHKDSIEEYSLIVGQSIYPYLTNEAKTQYARIFPSHIL